MWLPRNSRKEIIGARRFRASKWGENQNMRLEPAADPESALPAWTGCIWFLLLCFGGNGVISLFTIDGMETWYRTLRAPAIMPPKLVFALVWLVLYGLIGVAGWRLWRRRRQLRGRLALAAWGLQLLLNFAWPILFFALHLIGPALGDVFLLAAATMATIVLALGVDRPAALLLVPYLVWVSFAGLLNEAFLRLN